MRPFLLYIAYAFFLLAPNAAHTQSQNDYWYFGDSAGIRFVNDTVVPLTNSLIHSQEACASISDSNGNLLFYTDGITVWNNNSIMDNGSGLAGGNINPGYGSSSTNGVTILPYPNSDSLYCIITVESFNTTVGMVYSEVDMSQNGGLGRVTSNKNIQLVADSLCEKVSAVKHANGRDWWVICRSLRQGYNRFHKMLLTPVGWEGPFVQDIGTVNTYLWINYFVGEAEFSSSGERYICLGGSGQLDLFDFDRCLGLLSNFESLSNVTPWVVKFYGTSFSLAGTKLYVSNFDSLFQYDLTSQDIKNSKILIWTDNSSDWDISQHQLGPDGRIYVSTNWDAFSSDTLDVQNQNLIVIEYPDSIGMACSVQPYSISLGPNRAYLGLPNNPNYALGPLVGSACDTLSVGVLEPEKVDVQIHPNPNSGLFTLEFQPNNRDVRSCCIKDMTGRTIFKEAILPGHYRMEIDVARFVDGVYFVELSGDAGTVYRSKVLVQK